MSLISAIIHHHSLWSRFRHSAQGVANPRPVRLARLIADLSNGINQQPPDASLDIVEYPAVDIAVS
jgi:hypothetical protein